MKGDAVTIPSSDPLVLLVRRWRTILLLTAIGCGSGLAYGFLAPKWFMATLTVVPSQRSDDTFGLASKLPFAIDSVPTNVQRIEAVLTSNSVSDAVIDKFRLKERYGTEATELARAALWSHCGASVDRKSGVVSLSCEDQDPQFAMEMTAYFGEVGNHVFGRISASSAREERKFLEAQVTKARADVEEASEKLKAFQEAHKIIDLPEQSKAVISAMASIKGEMLSKQLELSYLTSFSSRTEAGVIQLQQQIAIMNEKLAQLEASQPMLAPQPPPAAGKGSNDKSSEFFPGAMNVPELRLELERLIREQKITETVFFLMTQRFEMAKVDEARDTSTFQILDQPTLPSHKARPKRLKIALLGFIAGIALSCGFVLVPAWLRSRVPRQ